MDPILGENAGIGSGVEVLTREIASGAEVLSAVIAAAGLRFWRWSERFPSLASMERWMMMSQPFWSVMVESDALAKESPESVRQMERWMVPNKLADRSRI
ncbi:plasmid SOS inhibition protein A [Enterobacter cloacae]